MGAANNPITTKVAAHTFITQCDELSGPGLGQKQPRLGEYSRMSPDAVCAPSAADEEDRHREGEREEAEQAELEEEVGKRPPAGRRSLELGRNDQHSPYDGDQADEQERLDSDFVRPQHEAKGVHKLGDDQRQQDPVEHRYGDVDGALSRRDPMRELVNRADEDEHGGGREQ